MEISRKHFGRMHCFSGVLESIFSNTMFILFRSLCETMQVWHGILHRDDLYVAITSSFSSISAIKNDMHAAKIICRPLILKYSASGFSNKSQSIILKHL